MRSTPAVLSSQAQKISMRLEVIVIPVSDVDRAKSFYSSLGWRLDADFVVGDAFRVVQLTPPGSACSIHFGKGVTPAAPGSMRGTYLIVSDIEAIRADLVARGIEVSDVFHRTAIGGGTEKGVDPERRSYNSFATFSDPDGNTWRLQEVTSRLPGRVDPHETTYTSANDLATALRRAAAAHGQHEKQTGQRDENWPDWYAGYMVSEQAGQPLPR